MKAFLNLLLVLPLLLFLTPFFFNKSISLESPPNLQEKRKLLGSVSNNSGLLEKLNSAMQAMDGRDITNDSIQMQSCVRMMDNPQMMSRMMDRMIMKCEKDSVMCQVMKNKMMNSPNMMNRMMDDPEMMSRMMDRMMMRCRKDSAMCRMMQNKMMDCPNMMNGMNQRREHNRMDGKVRKKH